MRSAIFISILFYVFAPSGLFSQIPLTQLVYGAEEILLAQFQSHTGDSLIFLSKDFHSSGNYDDTVILLQSEVFPPFAMNEADKKLISQKIISRLQQSKGILLFLHHREGNVVYPFISGMRIPVENEVRYSDRNVIAEHADFIEMWEKITWDEMLQRVRNVEARLQTVFALNKIKNPSKRNKALFQWLEDHMHEFNLDCDFNADCGWGNIQDLVLRWIIAANDIEDSWKVTEIYQRIYPGELKSFDGFDGVYSVAGDAFTSPQGLNFLKKKAFYKNNPVIERKQAIKFMLSASNFLLLDTFQKDPYFKKRNQADLQQELLDSLMPLLYDEQLGYVTFINVIHLSSSEDPAFSSRENLSKIPELMEFYRSEPDISEKFKDRLIRFLLRTCTPEQWKSLTGNDALIHINITQIHYNQKKQQLNFHISYNVSEVLLKEKPKVHLEKWEDGKPAKIVVKEFFNGNGNEWKPGSTYWNQVVDVGDLTPGEWIVYLSGVAGENGQYVWTSDKGRFIKE